MNTSLPTPTRSTARSSAPAALATRPSLGVPRVREQAREALAVMAFSAVASTALAALLLSLALLAK